MRNQSFLEQLTRAVILTAIVWGGVWFIFAVTP